MLNPVIVTALKHRVSTGSSLHTGYRLQERKPLLVYFIACTDRVIPLLLQLQLQVAHEPGVILEFIAVMPVDAAS